MKIEDAKIGEGGSVGEALQYAIEVTGVSQVSQTKRSPLSSKGRGRLPGDIERWQKRRTSHVALPSPA